MGLHRQGVQHIVNELVAEGIVALAENPHHRQAGAADPEGRSAVRGGQPTPETLAKRLAKDLPPKTIATAHDVLKALRERLELAEFAA